MLVNKRVQNAPPPTHSIKTMTTFTIATTTFHTDAPEKISARCTAFNAAVSPVLKGFAAVPAKYRHDSHTWQGDRVSSGFPPLDSAISVLTSTKFEAYLYTALELALYAVAVTLYLAVESAVMLWELPRCQAWISAIRGSGRYQHLALAVKGANAQLLERVSTVKTRIQDAPAKALKAVCDELDRQTAAPAV